MGNRTGNAGLYALLGLGVAMVIGGALVEALPDAPRSPSIAEEATPEPLPATSPTTEPATPPVHPPTPAAAPHDEEVTLVWNAEVTGGDRFESTPVPCVLALRVARRLAGPEALRAIVECDAERVFDGNVVTQQLWEVPLDGQSFAHRADLTAVRMTNAGRATLTASTGEHRVTVVDARGMVELYVQDLSAPRVMDPLWSANQGQFGRVQRSLRRLAFPVSIEGDAPAAVREAQRAGRRPGFDATTCELFVSPVPNERTFNCRLVVRCGDTLLYGLGTSGYNRCVLAGGGVVSARDEGTTVVDSDAEIELDVVAQTLRLHDQIDDAAGSRAYTIDFELAQDPRCGLAGQWTGAAIARDGVSLTWRMPIDGAEAPESAALVTTGGGVANGTREVGVRLDCDAGRVHLDTRSADLPELSLAAYALDFGPGWRGLAGAWRAGPDDAGALWGQRR